VPPRLHPHDPVARAVNRAWTDYVPTFAEAVTATAYADSESDYRKAAENIPVPFERLERALEKQGSGPFFNGAKYALVDAAYAPFLQRYFFLDRVKALGHIEKFPRLAGSSEPSPTLSLSREPEAAKQVGVAIRRNGSGRGGVVERRASSEESVPSTRSPRGL